jgi:antitoxin HicB
MTDADTREEALEEIDQIKREWLEIALEEGIQIAEPKLEEEYSGKFNLRVGRSLHCKLVEAAEREGVSLNHFCSEALAEAVGRYNSSEKIQARYQPARVDDKSSTKQWRALSETNDSPYSD